MNGKTLQSVTIVKMSVNVTKVNKGEKRGLLFKGVCSLNKIRDNNKGKCFSTRNKVTTGDNASTENTGDVGLSSLLQGSQHGSQANN